MTERFEVGDLVILPEESTDTFEYDDYGVVTEVTIRENRAFDGLNGIYYHIYWAIDQCDTIEDYEWVHQHIKLVQRA